MSRYHVLFRVLFRLMTAISLIAVCVAPGFAQDKKPRSKKDGAGFVRIFNEKDLSEWEGEAKHWSVEDGALTGVTDGTLKRNSFIVWRGGVVRNFEMRVKVKITAGGNSGLQYRSVRMPEVGPDALTGYQCDIYTTNPDEFNGMLYEERGRRILARGGQRVVIDPAAQPWVVGKVSEVRKWPTDVWNEYRVLVRGNHHEHWINGQKIIDAVDLDEKGRRLEGLIGVQVHVGPAMKVQFKEWRLKVLPEAPLLKPEQAPIPADAVKVIPQNPPRQQSVKQ
ncbi:MAG: DUF1080 domain-containing protein [Blastocatellia bacterium]